jgi:hypothetical protein
MNGGIMRLRHWSYVALLFLLIWAGAGWRDSGSTAGAAVVQASQSPAESSVPLPNKDGSLKFCVLGDFGTGDPSQYQLAEQMARLHERFKYDLVVLVGPEIARGALVLESCT